MKSILIKIPFNDYRFRGTVCEKKCQDGNVMCRFKFKFKFISFSNYIKKSRYHHQTSSR